MPKTTTSEFDREWLDPIQSSAVYKIEYKRRYWNGSAYVWEASATALKSYDVAEIGPITSKYDTPTRTKILTSNVTISLSNEDWKWMPGNLVSGLWKADATATLGYVPYRTEFTIYYGYELPDETTEFIAQFTGEVQGLRFSSQDNLAVFSLSGREERLKVGNAENIIDTLTDLSAGVGDGTIVQFDTSKKSVWVLNNVAEIAPIVIDANNNKIDFVEPDVSPSQITATLVSGTYPVGQTLEANTMCENIRTAMSAGSSNFYIVNYSYTTKKFTISTSGGTFSILWKTGTNGSDGTDTHAGTVLGFDDTADDATAASHTSDNATTSATKTQGTDYTIDQINKGEDNALINFESGSVPANKATIIYSGKQWKRDQKVSTLVGLLCDEAGIGSGIRTITEPVWPVAGASVILTSQANFEAGTLLDIDTKTLPGSAKGFILDDWNDEDHDEGYGWNVSGGSWDVISGVLTHSGATGTATLSDAGAVKQTGAWRIRMFQGTGTSRFKFFVVNGSFDGSNWYSIDLDATTVKLIKSMDRVPSLSNLETTLITSTRTPSPTDHYMVTRDGSGNFNLYVDTGSGFTSLGTATDTAIGSSTRIVLRATSEGALFDSLGYSAETNGALAFVTTEAVWTSAEQDLLAAPLAWTNLIADETLNDGTITYQVNVSSTSGSGYDGWITVVNGAVPTNALKRYVQIRAKILWPVGNNNPPAVNSIRLNYQATELFIKQADFTGMDCFAAMQELAVMANGLSVFTFDGLGNFLFQARANAGSADFNINQSNVIQSLDLDMNYKGIINKGVVNYGSGDNAYNSEYGATEASEASPTSAETYGEKARSYNASRFLFSSNASFADAISQAIYEDGYLQKRKATCKCRIIPQLDLSDRLSVTMIDDPLLKKVVFGDPLQKGFPPLGTPTNVMLRGVSFEAVGSTMSIDKSEMTLQLEEIL